MTECDETLGTLRGLLEGEARAEASRQSRSSVQPVLFAVLEQVHKEAKMNQKIISIKKRKSELQDANLFQTQRKRCQYKGCDLTFWCLL